MDSLFSVKTIASTPNPQQVIYAALHQDYSDKFVGDEVDQFPSEQKCGEIAIDRLLKGGRGHYGALEHPQIVLSTGYFPHSVMQQIRTHRVGISMDVQSLRYTGSGIATVGEVLAESIDYEKSHQSEIELILASNEGLVMEIEKVIYLRPVGDYTDRQGGRYHYDAEWRLEDLAVAARACMKYTQDFNRGKTEEHARGLLPFDLRQHWVISLNVRSFMHILDLRWKADAQLECQWLCDLMWEPFSAWVPEIAVWYKTNRAHKARLSP